MRSRRIHRVEKRFAEEVDVLGRESETGVRLSVMSLSCGKFWILKPLSDEQMTVEANEMKRRRRRKGGGRGSGLLGGGIAR